MRHDDEEFTIGTMYCCKFTGKRAAWNEDYQTWECPVTGDSMCVETYYHEMFARLARKEVDVDTTCKTCGGKRTISGVQCWHCHGAGMEPRNCKLSYYDHSARSQPKAGQKTSF